jgi:hypothetical protein
MKLNDPFGRMARRREREYESLRQSLLNAGLTERAKAEELIESLKKRSKQGLWILIPLTAVAAVAFQTYAIFILAFGALLILWLTNTMRRGQEYIGRYIEEVCDNPEYRRADTGGDEQADKDSDPPARTE